MKTPPGISRRHLLLTGTARAIILASTTPTHATQSAESLAGNPYLGETLVFTQEPTLNFLKNVGAWEVNDSSGRLVASGSGGAAITIPITTPGYYTFNKNLPFLITEKITQLPWWGVCANFTNTKNSAFDPRRQAADLSKIGGGSLRETYLWEEVENKQSLGRYSIPPSTTQRDLEFSNNSIRLFFVAGNTHHAYGAWRTWDTPKMRAGWVAYVNAVLSLNPGIEYVEVGNELNGGFNQGDKSPENYVSLLQFVYPEIKKAHPNVKVIGGATAGAAQEYTEACFKAGIGKSIDGWSLHPYSHTANFIPLYIDKICRWATQNGAPEPPIHISEFGWSITPDENRTGNNARVSTEDLQASNLAEIGTVLFAGKSQGKVETAHWYNMVMTEQPDVPFDPSLFTGSSGWSKATEGGFGLFEQRTVRNPEAFAPRKAAFTFWLLNKVLQGKNYAGNRQLPTGDRERWVNVYKFATPNSHSVFAVHVRLPWISGSDNKTAQVSIADIIQGSPGLKKHWRAVRFDGVAEYGYGTHVTVDRGMRFFHFSDYPFRGDPYSAPMTVYGGILGYWSSKGGLPVFGNPVSYEEKIEGGYVQRFESKARIFWQKDGGGGHLWDGFGITSFWESQGGEKSVMGLPIGAEFDVPGGRAQLFGKDGVRHKVVWSEKGSGAVNLSSPIGVLWVRRGGEAGFGLPRGVETVLSDGAGKSLDFVKGSARTRVVWGQRYGAHPVVLSGAIGRAWLGNGGISGWGYPLGGEVPMRGKVVQRFSSGAIAEWDTVSKVLRVRRF